MMNINILKFFHIWGYIVQSDLYFVQFFMIVYHCDYIYWLSFWRSWLCFVCHDLILLLLYDDDDMIITNYDMDEINDFKLELVKQFETNDLGTLCYFLDIEVAYASKGYLLCQSKYTFPTFLNIIAFLIIQYHMVMLSWMWNMMHLMVFHFQIQPCIVLWLEIWCTITILYIAYIVSQFVSYPIVHGKMFFTYVIIFR